MRTWLSAALAGALVAGCTAAGPNYTGRFIRAPDATVAGAPVLAEWWKLLGDATLDQLQAQALSANPGIDAARARVAEARALIRQERANRMPALAVQASTVQAKTPGLDLQSGPPAAASGSPAGESDDSLSIYNLGLNANWEVEFAGGSARRIEAASAQAAAAAANVHDAQVQLTSEVARAYVGLREAQARAALLRQEEALQQETLQLTQRRYTQGTLPLFAVGNANAELESLKSRIAEADADVAVYKDALASLTGQAPGSLDALLAAAGPIPLPPQQVDVGDPGALISRRPDVRAAEQTLAASTARIGAASAANFPRLSFMGILGLGGTSPEDVLEFGNLSAIALPRLQWNLLDFGRAAAAEDQARATRDEAEARYREIVLRALQDAEQSLARFGQHRAAVAAAAQISRQANAAAELNRQRFAAGTISKTDLNVSLRQRQEARANLNRAVAAMTSSWIAVQKSLGLGWI
jgi:outer membrane protein, multidrug efflux system